MDMDHLLTQLERYLRDTLGITFAITHWEDGHHIPFFLQDRYRFFEAQILGQPCLFMVDKGEQEEPPAAIRKHIDQVQAKWNETVVYVRERITAYNRKRLVEQKIPFVVPGNQMYLPVLGLDFREHFRKPRPHRRELRPSSQTVLIYALLEDARDLSPTVLATKLGYSAMTMSRAFDELEAAGVAESSATGRGRERCLRFDDSKRDVWKTAQPLLKSPAKSRHTIHMAHNKGLPGPQAELSALAHYSMLAEPKNMAVALSREDWKALQQRDAVTHAMPDETNALIVEVWSYAPTLFASDGWVDRLSLYLSLRDTQDERVQAALDQVLEEVPW
jgi:DNA-binding MarR family transcriptional regulator